MNKDDLNSNNTHINLSHQRTSIRIENRILHIGDIIYCPSRVICAKFLSISSQDFATMQFYAQGFTIYTFNSSLLRLELLYPYQVNGQLY